MFLKAVSKKAEKANCSFLCVPKGMCSPVLSGMLGAGLFIPSTIHIPPQIEKCAILLEGVKCCKIFVLAQVLRTSEMSGNVMWRWREERERFLDIKIKRKDIVVFMFYIFT